MHEGSDTHTFNAPSDRVVIVKWVNSQILQMGWDEAEFYKSHTQIARIEMG